MNKSYYPVSNNNRADWWQNISTVGTPVLTDLGFSTEGIASIMADAAWGVYLYRTLRVAYEEGTKRVTGYANSILSEPNGTPLPAPPTMPTWPTPPTGVILCGIEDRRELWVRQAKGSANYDPGTSGATLRLEPPVNPFNPGTYTARLFDLSNPAAKQVRFKFSKEYGNVDGINLYGRKNGDSAWIFLGRFNATPGNALVPLASSSPEEWQFQARAVKRDVEIGHPSPVMTLVIRG